MPLRIRIFSRPGCHLCDEMKAVVDPVARELGAVVEEVDIAADPALEREYRLEIPVLWINGRKAFKFRVSERDLRARLQREAGKGAR